MTEYVIRGNSAILKCSIPSYIAEFVSIEAWIREDGEVYVPEYQQTDKIPQGITICHRHEFINSLVKCLLYCLKKSTVFFF